MITTRVPCEIYTRVCGFFRPVHNFNPGKKQEFIERKYLAMPRDIDYSATYNKEGKLRENNKYLGG